MAYFITGGHPLPEESFHAKERRGNSSFEDMDGDRSLIRLVDNSQDDGHRIVDGTGAVGRPLKPDHIPTKLSREPWSIDRVPLLDVETYLGGSLLVCETLKDLLEELEPDVHQFWPMEIYVKGEMVALRYWFVACHRIRALSREHCYPPLSERGWWDPSPLGQRENDRIVFSSEAIGGRHAWVDKAYSDRMFSDEFAERLMKLNLTGLQFVKEQEATDETPKLSMPSGQVPKPRSFLGRLLGKT
ncbi:hypothetical protein CLV80_101150 [Yoonia maritima]|uniref:Immunity MXAN-0049 protein domain-containing protein n=1 Tax=Yoonia maritima TaxID=1435347 RepID=A0A2T0W4B1_9RHOB|nr:DUF1629 domain-containing protein [Yoonia maritima]PRY80299.1 hypothetical protein CLV80_101150 [Yoonia maritima]